MNKDAPTARDICDTVKGRHCEFKCSACGGEIIEIRLSDKDFVFCPFCGRKLEEV